MNQHFIPGKMYEIRCTNPSWIASLPGKLESRIPLKKNTRVVVLKVNKGRENKNEVFLDLQILADNGLIGWLGVSHVYIQAWKQVSE